MCICKSFAGLYSTVHNLKGVEQVVGSGEGWEGTWFEVGGGGGEKIVWKRNWEKR